MAIARLKRKRCNIINHPRLLIFWNWTIQNLEHDPISKNNKNNMGYSASLPGRSFSPISFQIWIYCFQVDHFVWVFFDQNIYRVIRNTQTTKPNPQLVVTWFHVFFAFHRRSTRKGGTGRIDPFEKTPFSNGENIHCQETKKNGYLKMKMTAIFEKDIFWYISQSISFSGVHKQYSWWQRKASRSQ